MSPCQADFDADISDSMRPNSQESYQYKMAKLLCVGAFVANCVSLVISLTREKIIITIQQYSAGCEPFSLWEGLDTKSEEYRRLKEERAKVLMDAVEVTDTTHEKNKSH